MRIANILNAQNYNNSFRSNKQKSYIEDSVSCKNTEVWHTTCLFRGSYQYWIALANFMTENFKDKDKVNVYDLACSDGSETYSIAIALNEVSRFTGENSKFLPIFGSDFNKDMIKIARSGKLDLSYTDFKNLSIQTQKPLDYFYGPDFPILESNANNTNYNSYSACKYLQNAVCFEQKDINSKLNEIQDNGNTVVFIRNVFPYLSGEYLKETMNLLNTKLKAGSMLILGDLENCSHYYTNDLLEKFKPVCGATVFRKFV